MGSRSHPVSAARMDIPPSIESAIGVAVTHHLQAELAHRGLLLTGDYLAEAETATAQRGARLLVAVIHWCYPISRQGSGAHVVEFNLGKPVDHPQIFEFSGAHGHWHVGTLSAFGCCSRAAWKLSLGSSWDSAAKTSKRSTQVLDRPNSIAITVELRTRVSHQDGPTCTTPACLVSTS
jgi:hypothetical protein